MVYFAFIYTWRTHQETNREEDTPKQRRAVCLAWPYMLNMRSKNKKYGILFIFRPFYEYSHLEYVHVPVCYRVHQAEYVSHTRVAASKEYVNTDSTPG